MRTSFGVRFGSILAATATAAALGIGLANPAGAVVGAPTGLAVDGHGGPGTAYKDVVLTWTAVAGATSYDVQLNDDGLWTPARTLTAATAVAQYAPPVSLPRATYQWRVRAHAGSTVGDWSAAATFVRGWYDAPVPASGPVPGDLRFSWQPLADAAVYELEWDTDPSFANATAVEQGKDLSNGKGSVCFTPHTSYTPYTLQVPASERSAGSCEAFTFTVGTTYHWRVRGRDTTFESPQSTFPAAGVTCTGVLSGPTITQYAAAPECSHWSAEGSFTLAVPGGSPGIPTGLTTDCSGVCALTPTFSWDPEAGTTYYRVYFSRTQDFTDSDLVYAALGHSLTPRDDFADRSIPLYWAVQACTGTLDTLSCGGLSTPSTFTRSTPAGVSLLSPADGATPGTPNVALSWSTLLPAGEDAAAYDVQVARDQAFAVLVDSARVDARGGTDGVASYLAEDTPYPATRLWWRVRAVNAFGDPRPWTAARGFSLDVTAPVARIATASGFGPTAPLTVTFSEPVSGVSSSSLGIVVAGGATRLAGGVRVTGPATAVFTPTRPWTPGQHYAVTVTGAITDSSGNAAVAAASTVRASTLADSTSPAIVRSTGWTTHSASDAVGRSYISSAVRSARVGVTMRGTAVSFYGCRGPASGIAVLYLDGRWLASVDLYQPWSSCGRLFTRGGLADLAHGVVVIVSGSKRAASHGATVAVDALATG